MIIWLVIDLGSLISSHFITNQLLGGYVFSTVQYKTYMMVLMLSWIISFLTTQAYTLTYFKNAHLMLIGLGRCMTVHILLLLICYSLLSATLIIDIRFIIVANLIFLMIAYVLRLAQGWLYMNAMKLSKFQTRYVIIGNAQDGQKLHEYILKARYPGFIFLGFFEKQSDSWANLGDLHQIFSFCRANQVNQIFCALPSDSQLFSQIFWYADQNYIRFAFLKDELPLTNNESLLVRPYASPKKHQFLKQGFLEVKIS
jgi:FlaA1/EpsC-like NDP-sugar epimerase